MQSNIVQMVIFGIVFVSTANAQLTFGDSSAAAGLKYIGQGGGVSFGDYNNDGFEDIYIVNEHGGEGVLFKNNGDGTFTDVTGTAGVSVVASGEGGTWIDHDRNGFLDIYVSNEASPNALYHNNGDGTFVDVAGATGAANTGTSITGIVSDFNNDGAEDIYVINLGANALLQGDFSGNFVDVTSMAGVGNASDGLAGSWGDFNGDGYVDIYVVNRGASNVLYMNNGDGTFTNNTSASGTGSTIDGFGVAIGDYDNDGDLDIYVSNEGVNLLYQNDGSGIFTDVAAAAGVDNSLNGEGVSFGDLDNDGDLDLYVGNQNGANALYLNDGSGVFTDIAASAGVENIAGAAKGNAFGDIDNDGDLDIYQSNFIEPGTTGEPNVFYVNDGNSNHYLNVRLKGLANNTLGFGSVITLKSGTETLMRIVEGGHGFSSHNSLAVEFGLGSLTSVDSIIVKWPYGREQVVVAPGIDATIIVTEDIYEHDMIAGSLSGIPTAEMIVNGDSIFPVATIANIGDSTETDYYVKLTISSDGVIDYQDSVAFTTPIASFESQNINLKEWVPSKEDTFDIELILGLATDQSLVNNMINATSTITFAVTPTVEIVNPGEAETNVSAGLPVIDATFSEGIDDSFVSSANFSAVGSVSGAIPGLVLYQPGSFKMALLISNTFDFASEEVVTVTLSGDIESLFGLGLDGDLDGVGEGSPTDDFVWSFTIETATGINDDSKNIPNEYSLSQNHPNPFNPVTSIEFSIPEDGEISLTVFDLNGKEVEKLASGTFRSGFHSVKWDASNVSSGVYFYRLSAPGYIDTKKMILLK